MVDPRTADVASITVEFVDGVPAGLDRLASEHPDEVTVMSASSFNAADPGTTEAVVVLTPVVLRALTVVVKAHLEARKSVRIKAKGAEITGVSGKDALKILAELSDEASE